MEKELKGGNNTRADFSKRAQALRSDKQTQAYQQRYSNIEQLKQGLTSTQFWKTKVHTKEDVELYFQIYHPEYPEIMYKALAERFTTLVQKANSGTKLDEEDAKYLTQRAETDMVWNPLAEIEEQKFIGQMKLAEKRMEELLQE